MKRIRIICPACGRGRKILKDEENTTHYEEQVIQQRCFGCPITPEEKLLQVIFGQEGPDE